MRGACVVNRTCGENPLRPGRCGTIRLFAHVLHPCRCGCSDTNAMPRCSGLSITLIAGLFYACAALGAHAGDQPHIVYITVDDLGWKDIGYHGSTVQTPTLDRLAASGARLEQFYVQPFSSQTRAAAMTGRYPMRYGMQTMQIQPSSR